MSTHHFLSRFQHRRSVWFVRSVSLHYSLPLQFECRYLYRMKGLKRLGKSTSILTYYMMQSSALTSLRTCSSSETAVNWRLNKQCQSTTGSSLSGCVQVKSTVVTLRLIWKEIWTKHQTNPSLNLCTQQMHPFSASNLVTLENLPRSGTANYRGTTTETCIQILSEDRSIKSLCWMPVLTLPDLGAPPCWYSEGSRLEAAIVRINEDMIWDMRGVLERKTKVKYVVCHVGNVPTIWWICHLHLLAESLNR